MNRPTPMTGRGKTRIQKKLWKLRYDRDSKKVERDFHSYRDNFKHSIPDELEEKSNKISEKKIEFLHCKKVKHKKKKYGIKDFFVALIFFFFKIFNPSGGKSGRVFL
ncbi:MAG: hypothetical protein PHH98_04690 [Candidatus Gracilibacteria bacterium]|nr:hypothetical protein [Candidatus Gracilibacteria bacterium]